VAGRTYGAMITARPLAPDAQAFREMLVGEALQAAGSATSLPLRMAGATLQLDIADPDVGAALLPALRHHVADAGGSTPQPATIAQLVVWSTPLPPFPWGGEHLGRGGAIAGLSHGAVRATAAADDTSLMLWDDERRLACCWFAGVHGVTRWDRAAPLRTALHFALAAPGRQLVHGATVGAGGRGVLLAGPGGSGKSTTTLACLEAGLQIVGDDYAAVELVGGRARAWNLYGSIKVGERDGGPDGRDDRRSLILGEDLPGAPTEALDLAAVLLPRVVGGPSSSLSRAHHADALRALAPSTLLQAPHEERPSLGLLADLARSLPAHHLNLGADRGVPAIREAVAA
jgi:hypothetical protein